MRKSVMLAVGRVHGVHQVQNKEDGEDLSETMSQSTARTARPNDRPLAADELVSRTSKVKFSAPGDGDDSQDAAPPGLLGSLSNLLGFGGEAKAKAEPPSDDVDDTTFRRLSRAAVESNNSPSLSA